MANFGDSAADEPRDNKIDDWSDFVPKRVDFEDAVGRDVNKAIWEKIYSAAGMKTAGENERKMVRLGIYVYCAKNGTSREGDYTGDIILANGRTVSASVIPNAASKMRIRKFLRANMIESYDALKSTRVMENDLRFVARCAGFGVSPECAFATADWMADCPKFTPTESRAHEIMFVRGIDRAKRARGGKALESVEAGRIDDAMRVQGPLHEQSNNGVEF